MAKQTKSGAESGSSTAMELHQTTANIAQLMQHPESSSLSEVMLWAQVAASDEGSTSSTFQLPELPSKSISCPSTPPHDVLSGWLSNYNVQSAPPALNPNAEPFVPSWEKSFLDRGKSFEDQLGVWVPATPTLQRWERPMQAPEAPHDLPPRVQGPLQGTVPSPLHHGIPHGMQSRQYPGEHSGGISGPASTSWPAVMTTTPTLQFSQNLAPAAVWNKSTPAVAQNKRTSWASLFPPAEHGGGYNNNNFQTTVPARTSKSELHTFHSVVPRSAAINNAASASSHQFRGDLRIDHIRDVPNIFSHRPGGHHVYPRNKQLGHDTYSPVTFSPGVPNYGSFNGTMPGSSVARPSYNFMSQEHFMTAPVNSGPGIGSWSTVNIKIPSGLYGQDDQMVMFPPERLELQLATPPALLSNFGTMPFRYPKVAPATLNLNVGLGSLPFRYPRVVQEQVLQTAGKQLFCQMSGGESSTTTASRKRPNPAVNHSGPALWNPGPRPTYNPTPWGTSEAASTQSSMEPLLTLGLAPSGPALNTNGKPRARRGCATNPQSVCARYRRDKISERVKILQGLIPNGTKVDTVTMLDEAQNYVKFLESEVELLQSNELAMPSSYKGLTPGNKHK